MLLEGENTRANFAVGFAEISIVSATGSAIDTNAGVSTETLMMAEVKAPVTRSTGVPSTAALYSATTIDRLDTPELELSAS